jgi:hypothetical protein
MKITYSIGGSLFFAALFALTSCGDDKKAQAAIAEQTAQINTAVEENLNAYRIQRQNECKQDALQKAIPLAEAKLGPGAKPVVPAPVVPAKKPVPATKPTTTKGGTKPAPPKTAPVVTPPPAPAPPQTGPVNTGKKPSVEVPKTADPSNTAPVNTGRKKGVINN